MARFSSLAGLQRAAMEAFRNGPMAQLTAPSVRAHPAHSPLPHSMRERTQPIPDLRDGQLDFVG